MNKQETIEKINNLPKFELRPVAVKEKDKEAEEGKFVEAESFKAVVEVDSLFPLCFCSNKYSLVQMDQAFLPLLEPIPEFESNLIYGNGMAILDVFPNDENFQANGDRFGIVFINSVNKTSAINIKFCIQHKVGKDKRILVLPKKLAGFKHIHVGKIVNATKDYLDVITKIRKVWLNVITNFTKEKVDEEYVKTVLEVIQFKDASIRKKIMLKVMSSSDMNLWDLFLDIIYWVSSKNYKSESHKRKKLDKISEAIFNYAVATKLIY